ncbi:hypothetical protein ACOZFM_11155 [Streptomyces arboris]|uniref:hypothetical protein n=1 Tax=Streptomyces arboris TaxID=2600619 RepID=UPI003BF57983
MGRQKPNKPRREKPVFGSPELDIAISEAMAMSLESNSIAAVTQGEGPLSGFLTVRDFPGFEEFMSALEWLRDVPASIFVVFPDVIELECRLANLPNIEKGTPMFDTHTRRTVRVYRLDTKEGN